MIYSLLRFISRVALRWFYREITVRGLERMPRERPVLLAVNHPNAMVDAIAVGTVLDRPVTLTAKATLMEHPLIAPIFRAVGIVPLRRARDERERLQKERAAGGDDARARDGAAASGSAVRVQGSAPAGGEPVAAGMAGGANVVVGGGPPMVADANATAPASDPRRNADSFRAILDVLERRGAVLIFPEGTSHSSPELAPLRTGLARIALEAREGRAIQDLAIVPVGLVFERKWEPRSRLLIEVGEPIEMREWSGGADSATELTAELDRRLRAVTINFPTREAADTVLGASATLAAVLDAPPDDVRPLGDPDAPLATWADASRRAEAVRQRMGGAAGAAGGEAGRVERFVARLEALRAECARLGVAPNDVGMRLDPGGGAQFALRESLLLVLGGPFALWGRLNHWAPITLARRLALRSSRNPDDPAMRTIVIGLVLVLAFYLAQGALVAWLAGPWWALLYLVTLPLSASWDFALRERMRRAHQRTRTWFLFRREPALQQTLRAEAAWLREEAGAIERGWGTGR